jgi:hypothetical protein
MLCHTAMQLDSRRFIMKLPQPGKVVWVSRFSPIALEPLSTESNPDSKLLKKDIFIRPYRAVITTMYPISRGRDKWCLVVEPFTTTTLSSMSGITWSKEPWEKKGGVGSASLLGSFKNGSAESFVKSHKYSKPLLLEVGVRNGKIVSVSNHWSIFGKRNEIFKKNQQILRKFQKMAKSNHKYNQMNMITSCLLDVHTASQLERMIQRNPENFI